MGIILTEAMMGERIRVVQKFVFCGAGVGTMERDMYAPPTGTGSVPTIAMAALVFGWRPPASESLASLDLCVVLT
jgi:hypothetical protein